MGGIGYASKHDTKPGAGAGQSSVEAKTSAAPAAPGPVPMPYPTQAVSPYGNAAQQDKVKAMQKSTTIASSSGTSRSTGDEAAGMKGIPSMGTASPLPDLSSTAPVDVSAMSGAAVKPSQTKVKVGS